MNNDTFSVGDTIIHKDGSYAVKIVKFVLADLTPPLIWFYDHEELKYVKDLNNFRKITVDDVSKYCPQYSTAGAAGNKPVAAGTS